MRIVNPRCGCPIQIGRLGENEATKIVFDVSEYAAFGSGNFSLLHQRAGDAAPYPCVIQQNGNTVEWEISSADCAVEGYGKCELIFTVGSVITKSKIYMTVTGTALTAGAEPPEPWEDWVQRVLSEGAEVESFLQTLEGGTPDQVWTKTETGAEWRTPQGGGSGGTSDHRQLTHRNDADQHQMSAITGLSDALAGKQGTIADLETIRSGAARGANSVQQEEGKGLFSGSYNDLTNKPTIPPAVTEYLKSASVSGNTLSLTKQDDSTLSFTPQGGGGGDTWHFIRSVTASTEHIDQNVRYVTDENGNVCGFTFDKDADGNTFSYKDIAAVGILKGSQNMSLGFLVGEIPKNITLAAFRNNIADAFRAFQWKTETLGSKRFASGEYCTQYATNAIRFPTNQLANSAGFANPQNFMNDVPNAMQVDKISAYTGATTRYVEGIIYFYGKN